MKKIDLSIIVPVYSGEFTINKLFLKIQDFCNRNQFTFQVIFVWDCGKDNSWEIIKKIKLKNTHFVSAVHLSRNFGQHNAILSAIHLALGRFIVTIDEDLQHSPDDISLLLMKQRELDYDVVYGVYSDLNHSFFRNITSKMMRKILQLSIPDLHNNYSAFRLMKREVAQEITKMNNSYTFLDGYISWITSHVSSVKVSHQKRIAGISSYSTKRLFEHSINIFATFSNLPIRILTKLSILIFSSTFLYSLYVVLRVILKNDMSIGFPSIIILIGLGVGSIMLGVGILGEYLYRISLKTTKRPNYFIKQEIK